MGFGMFGVLFFIVFLTVTAVFIVTLVRGIGQWNKNNHSPRLTVPVTVVAKRMNVSHHHSGDGVSTHSYTDTDYFATFQVESGDRFELSLPGREYGLMVEGDRCRLSFQGTRFLSFERT